MNLIRSISTITLMALLVPGTQIRASSSDLIDINSAAPAKLRSLPGMGDAYVHRVIEGRPYSAKNQLVTRGVLPQSAYDRIASYIVAHRAPH